MRARFPSPVLPSLCSSVLILIVLAAWGCGSETDAPAPPRTVDPAAQRFLAGATEALQQRAYMTGLALVDSAESRAPGLPEAQFIRGRLYFELGRLDAAGEAYRAVLARQPDYEGAWHNLGNVAFRQKRYAEALAYYRKEIARHPAPRPWHALGGSHEALGQADSARAAYRMAVARDDRYAPAYASLARWHENEGAFDEALAYAQKALALAPDDLDYQYTAGALLFRTGQYEAAVRQLQPVVEARPWNYSAWFSLGQSMQRLGREEEARRHLEQGARVRAEQAEVERLQVTAQEVPDNFQFQVDYAGALRRTGRLAEALQAYHVAQSLRPDNLALQNNLATLYLQQGDTLEALTRYRRILQQDSTFVEAWLNLGIHYARTGRMDAANRAWQRARALDPDHPTVKALLEKRRP